MAQETFTFQTEVGRLLDIVARSLYSHKDIFLRELISNASDACDRLRYAAITEPALIGDDGELAIRIRPDAGTQTLAVADNGIGMNRQDMIDTLGTIAQSGSQAFLAQLTGDTRKDVSIIGQFGVGFYSAFMVAKRVEVVSRRAGEDQAWIWSSDGRGEFTVGEGEREGRGTTVILHLNDDQQEFLSEARIRSVVKAYSDHIGFPIYLGEGVTAEKLNESSSLWTLPKHEISSEQYQQFYRHISHAFDDPWLTLHNSIEGVVSYRGLLFIPSQPPFDLFEPARKGHVRLYVKRVFITDDCEGLILPYLRFLRGVVDTGDLPLNISRESFQHDARLAKIRSQIVKRVLDESGKKADESVDEYSQFWGAFGQVLKEGIYEDFENRDRVLSLARFHSTGCDRLTSLDAYLERMLPGQDAIYTLTGEELDTLKRSPQLEGFRAKGVDVLLLNDAIDEFWIPAVHGYKEKRFISAAGADVDLRGIEPREPGSAVAAAQEAAPAAAIDHLIAVLKSVLKENVKDVRVSQRLTDSAVCLVSEPGDLNRFMERLMRAQHRGDSLPIPRVLEINPSHPLIRRMADRATAGDDAEAALADSAFLLLDQARIMDGDRLTDPIAFARRMTAALEKGIAVA